MALALGRALWRQLPATAHAAAGRPPPLNFPAAAQKVGFLDRLERKPWVLLGDVRESLEASFGLATDELLIAMAHWLESTVGAPCSVGLAHTSGNVYFGPALSFGSRTLAPEQTLIANLYSHGEMGLDSVASYRPPSAAAAALLQEVATFKRMRWLDANLVCTQSSGGLLEEVRAREPGSVIRNAKPRLFKKYPLVSEAVAAEHLLGEAAAPGTCMQHAAFKFLDIEGSGMDEWQASLARNSMIRGYGLGGGPAPAGCAVLTTKNLLYAGFSLLARGAPGGSLSPLESALGSLGANGALPADIVKVVWTDDGSEDASKLRCGDEALLRSLVPDAAFEPLPPSHA